MKKGTPHFLYTNKDSPDYVAPFAPFYSDRQKAILSGELSVEEVELRELGRLRNKARNMGDEENLEIANILYEERVIHPQASTSTTPPRKRRKSCGS